MLFGRGQRAAPSAPTYTMTGKTGTIESRVTYKDESNTMNCRWEKGDIVTLKADGGGQTYDFVVTSVDGDGVGTMAHEGAIPSADNFTGTATYAPRDAAKAGVQIGNDSTTHLKYGETMVATLKNQKIDGASLVFSHPATAVYKVRFKAPVNFSAGSTLTMSGAWTADAVLTLGFGAAKDDIVTAYIIHTAGDLAASAYGGEMKFSLAVKDGDTYSYKFTSAKALTYEANKYWLANISDKTMEKEVPHAKLHVTVTNVTESTIDLSYYVTDSPEMICWYKFFLDGVYNGEGLYLSDSYRFEKNSMNVPLKPGTKYTIRVEAQDIDEEPVCTWVGVVKTAEAAN